MFDRIYNNEFEILLSCLKILFDAEAYLDTLNQ